MDAGLCVDWSSLAAGGRNNNRPNTLKGGTVYSNSGGRAVAELNTRGLPAPRPPATTVPKFSSAVVSPPIWVASKLLENSLPVVTATPRKPDSVEMHTTSGTCIVQRRVMRFPPRCSVLNWISQAGGKREQHSRITAAGGIFSAP